MTPKQIQEKEQRYERAKEIFWEGYPSAHERLMHFFYWLPRYIRAVFFGHIGLPSGYRWDWMTWKEYKRMTRGLLNKPGDLKTRNEDIV